MRLFASATATLLVMAGLLLACSQTPCADQIVGDNNVAPPTLGEANTNSTNTVIGGTADADSILIGQNNTPPKRVCLESNTNQGPLFAPGLPKYTLLKSGGVEFTWLDSNSGKNNEDGYTLERRLPNTNNWALIGSYPADTSSAIDPVPAESITYFYRIITYRDGVTAPTKELRVEFPDITPPETELLFHPPLLAGVREASFILRSSEGGGNFICQHAAGDDEPSAVDCSDQSCIFGDTRCRAVIANLGSSRLRGGENFFSAAAIDAAGNVDPSPVGFEWEIDVTPPLISFLPTPQAVYGPDHIIAGKLKFNFDSDDHQAEYWCSVTTQDIPAADIPWTACNSANGFSFDYGADGQTRTFAVAATDTLGNGSIKSFTFTIDTQPPQVEFMMPTTTYLQPVGLFGSIVRIRDDGTAPLGGRLHASRRAACIYSRNGIPFAAVNNDNCLPSSYVKNTTESIDLIHANFNLEGRFTLHLAVTDAVGNTTGSTLSWLHDATPPHLAWVTTPIDYRHFVAPLGMATAVSSSFLDYAFRADNHAIASADPQNEKETVRHFYCSWDGGMPVLCGDATWPIGVFTVAEVARHGIYTFAVTAVDLAGNVATLGSGNGLSHSVSVDYPGYSTDIANAAGSALIVREFNPGPYGVRVVSGGCNFLENGTYNNANPLLDPTFLGLQFVANGGSAARIYIDYHGFSSTPITFGQFGNPGLGPNGFVGVASSSNVTTTGPRYNVIRQGAAFEDSIVHDDPGIPLQESCRKWTWETSLRNNTSSVPTASHSLAKFTMGMAGTTGKHIAIRMRHPQHVWVADGGQIWQHRFMLHAKFLSSTPATMAIHLEVPRVYEPSNVYTGQEDRLATRIQRWEHLPFNKDGYAYSDLIAEAPHCTGMAQIRAEVYDNSGNKLSEDYARYVVGQPLVAADSYEPNAYGSPAPSSSAFPATNLTLTNLRLEGGVATQQDTYRLGIDVSKNLSLRVRDASVSGTNFYVSLMANGVTVTNGLAAANHYLTDGPYEVYREAHLQFSPFDLVPNAEYVVMVTAPSVSGCMRYRLEADQY